MNQNLFDGKISEYNITQEIADMVTRDRSTSSHPNKALKELSTVRNSDAGMYFSKMPCKLMKEQSLTADISGETKCLGILNAHKCETKSIPLWIPNLKVEIIQEIPMTTEDTLTLYTLTHKNSTPSVMPQFTTATIAAINLGLFGYCSIYYFCQHPTPAGLLIHPFVKMQTVPLLNPN
jgi:hypothetical protein